MDTSSETGSFDASTHTFFKPEKQIKSPEDMGKWTGSQAYSNLVGFILTLNEAVKNKKVGDEYPVSEMTENMVGLLNTIDGWITETPPIDQPQRFGNKAFRKIYTRLQEEGPSHLEKILPPDLSPAVSELSTYLLESVGNDTRIDYGTGHELAFVAFLCCACRVGIFEEEDYPALVLKIFDRYLYLVRKLQTTYRMEPAGSQGVWSLDDYQFLPFLWGSAQLLDHPRIRPKSFPEEDIYNSFYKDYLFLAAIKYINTVKTGPFAEHSNQLWGISGVAGWPKVNSGLIKMYKAEVLGKFPVVQHFLFGSLLTMEPAPPRSSVSSLSTASSPALSSTASPKSSIVTMPPPFSTPTPRGSLLSVGKSTSSVPQQSAGAGPSDSSREDLSPSSSCRGCI
ncbi:serine/threonine-protein phosphatase 2A activator [Elysia marginata]|uniref:Serine/threonine-protein phosphatase 2A activator n=1 Tax=Elysia marginata TaxID=1093978 RepID=A0AAV4EN44_9GAST|nr:serine/threonine-protein phosphatase 2A activator [Elysia marginata]